MDIRGAGTVIYSTQWSSIADGQISQSFLSVRKLRRGACRYVRGAGLRNGDGPGSQDRVRQRQKRARKAIAERGRLRVGAAYQKPRFALTSFGGRGDLIASPSCALQPRQVRVRNSYRPAGDCTC